MRRSLFPVVAAISAAFLLCGCGPQGWFAAHKTQVAATGKLIEQKALSIAEKAVYSKALDALDAVLKGNNVSGFGDSLRSIEGTAKSTALSEIPDAVMQLREIWLGPQSHYTDLATDTAKLIQSQIAAFEAKAGRKILPAEATAIFEDVIKGLQQPPPALVGA